MINHTLQAIILAAGKSSRFNTGRNKLLEKMCGQELILYPIKIVEKLRLPTIAVVGHQKEQMQTTIQQLVGDSITYITQEEQYGTAHALLTTKDMWHKDHILIMHADMPLLTSSLIEQLYQTHRDNNAKISFVMAHNADPSLGGYGRVIKHENGYTITEQPSYDAQEICCVNAGIYIVEKNFLERVIEQLELGESHKECSFSSIVNVASSQGLAVQAISAPFDYVRGINTLQELWAAEHIKRSELIRFWMERGVAFPMAHNVHIDLSVSIGTGSFIGSGVQLTGDTTIGNNCKVHEYAIIENSTIGEETTIHAHSIIKDSFIGNQAKVGPFAHIREKSTLADQTIIGNFVEIKKSSIGAHTKAKHLTYLGDANVGEQVNIGAGTITCNHNGVTKNKTIIEDNAYIGANNTLIAPLTIGNQAFTAAGSVITHDVPAQALALGRARQVIKEGYALKIREQSTQQEPLPAQPDSSFVGAIKTDNDSSAAAD